MQVGQLMEVIRDLMGMNWIPILYSQTHTHTQKTNLKNRVTDSPSLEALKTQQDTALANLSPWACSEQGFGLEDL